MDGRVFHLRKLFLSDLARIWSIEEMARSVELSPPHLHKLFKSNLGISPLAYLHNLRLEKARELLETTFLQIKQIANQTGLHDDSHFTRDFKGRFGLAPTKYREHCWEREQSNPLAGL